MICSADERLFIVTASHVARKMESTSILVLGGADDRPVTLQLESFAKIGSSWKHHDQADIAIREVSVSGNEQLFEGRFLPIDLFDKELNAASRDDDLTAFGFPLGLGVGEFFSPLTFVSRASSGLVTLPRFDTKQPCNFFILENPSIGGYSGCPVFTIGFKKIGALAIKSGGVKCYGFMHGTISDDTGGKLAAVTPSHYLFDLL